MICPSDDGHDRQIVTLFLGDEIPRPRRRRRPFERVYCPRELTFNDWPLQANENSRRLLLMRELRRFIRFNATCYETRKTAHLHAIPL